MRHVAGNCSRSQGRRCHSYDRAHYGKSPFGSEVQHPPSKGERLLLLPARGHMRSREQLADGGLPYRRGEHSKVR